jgi:hypothetical protein
MVHTQTDKSMAYGQSVLIFLRFGPISKVKSKIILEFSDFFRIFLIFLHKFVTQKWNKMAKFQISLFSFSLIRKNHPYFSLQMLPYL